LAEQIHIMSGLEQDRDKVVAHYYNLYHDILLQKSALDQTVVKNQMSMFDDAVSDQQRLSVSAKKLLQNRLDALLKYQITQEAHSKADQGASTEKLALEQKETEEKEKLEKQNFDEMNQKVRDQIEQYNVEKSKLMRWALRELVRENIEHGEQMISLWKELGSSLDQ